MAAVQADVLDKNLDDLAMKGDIKELDGKMREFEARILGEIRLNRWMLALIIVVTVLPALRSLLG